MGTILSGAAGYAVDPIAWTRRREDGGRPIIEKCASLAPEGTHARVRLRNHYLITLGLDCPGVAQPYGLSNTESGLVLSLPWIPGVDLDAYVKGLSAARGGAKLRPEEALDIASKVAGVLANLAECGIVHRGLSPDHIVVDSTDGKVSLLNFGASRFMRGVSSREPDAVIDHSEDLIALGRLLYWLATGRTLESDGPQPRLAHEAIGDVVERIRDPLARLLNAGRKDGYWHAAAAAADLLARRDAKILTPLGPCGAPPDLVLSRGRLGRKPGFYRLLDAYSEVAGVTANNAGRGGRDRKRPVLAIVRGRAGVGKTTLAMDACRAMERIGARVEFGKFNQFGDARPMSALLHALDGVVGQILEEDKAQRDAFAARILKALEALAQVVADVVPRLMFLLGPQPVPPALSGEASRARFELLLRRFVGVLATPERPLVLFLDDLQWADQPSLELLRGLLRDHSIRWLLVVGAYRTEAVPRGHPLLAMMDTIGADGGDLRKLTVAPWTQRDIIGFLGDTQIAAGAQRDRLAGILHRITGGNPLGVLMGLRGVQDAGCLQFDLVAGLWRADVETAGAELAKGEIIALVSRQLARLPAACCDMVATSMLLGASFDLESVAAGTGETPRQVLKLLWPALARGLLIADDDPQPFTMARLRARHDIVQQAAYLTIGEERTRQLHGAIGRAMFDAYTADESLPSRVFEVVQQLNKASDEGLADDERWRLIELNVTAGRQARSTGARNAAFEHYGLALRLVADDDWADRADAIFELKLGAAEAAYLAAEFLTLDRLIGELETLPLRSVDAARVQELRMQSLVARGRLGEAIEVGQRALALLGSGLAPLRDPSEWPPVPSLDELMVGLPSDERIDAILRILVRMTPCAIGTSFEIYMRVILSMMELALARPFSILTPISFANYGITLCSIGRNKEGFQAGQRALALTENVDEVSLACKVHTVAYGFLTHWSDPARKSLQPMLDAVRAALLCGDQEYVGYASFLYCDKAWGIESLATLDLTLTDLTGVVEQFGQDFSWHICQVWLQFVQTLLGRSHLPLALVGDVFDMRVDIPRLEAVDNQYSLFTARVLIAILSWHRGDHAAALDQCRKANQYVSKSIATLMSVDHVMFWCLCELNGYSSLPDDERAEKLKWIDASIARLRGWAEDAPDNVAHKLALVEAERARALADTELARRNYEIALERAASNDFLHDRAMIEERTGDFYESIGQKPRARELLLKAREEYKRWGSTAIALAMGARYALPV